MIIDIKSLSQNEKNSFYAATAMVITFVLPWWSYSSNVNFIGFGQNLNSGGTISHNGFQMYGFLLGLAGSVGAGYFITQKNRISIWFAVAGVAHAVNTYFGLVGLSKADFNVSANQYGNVSFSSGYSYGFYLYALASFILLFLEAKRLGLLSAIKIELGPTEKNKVPENTNQEP